MAKGQLGGDMITAYKYLKAVAKEGNELIIAVKGV